MQVRSSRSRLQNTTPPSCGRVAAAPDTTPSVFCAIHRCLIRAEVHRSLRVGLVPRMIIGDHKGPEHAIAPCQYLGNNRDGPVARHARPIGFLALQSRRGPGAIGAKRSFKTHYLARRGRIGWRFWIGMGWCLVCSCNHLGSQSECSDRTGFAPHAGHKVRR